jgi:hypothetical protein
MTMWSVGGETAHLNSVQEKGSFRKRCMVCWREMASIFHPVAAWWTLHPNWVAFIYFVTAILVSLFTDRARRLAILPVLYPVKGVLWLMERQMKRELEILRLVGNNNTFKLVSYIGFYCVDSLIYSVWTTIGFSILIAAFSFWQHDHSPKPPFYALFLGALLPRVIKLKHLLGCFFEYDKSIAELEERLSMAGSK